MSYAHQLFVTITAEFFGPFCLTRRLGCGGMAEVRLGCNDSGEPIAVKRLLPTLAGSQGFTEMLLDEAKLVARLDHPNIVKNLEFGLIDDEPYIVFEHVDGLDLFEIFASRQRLGVAMPAALACFVVKELCQGLHHAHTLTDEGGKQLQIVHRDVSLPNVLVSFEGEVKVIDFGIASALESRAKPDPECLMGRIAYMSPEQIRGLPVDCRSDVFSAGIVLWELLTGERLFHRQDSRETFRLVKDTVVPRPSMLNPSITEPLERVVLKALACHEDDRFDSASAMAENLDAMLQWSRIQVGPDDLSAWLGAFFSDRRLQEDSDSRRQTGSLGARCNATSIDDIALIESAESMYWADPDNGVKIRPIVNATGWAPPITTA